MKERFYILIVLFIVAKGSPQQPPALSDTLVTVKNNTYLCRLLSGFLLYSIVMMTINGKFRVSLFKDPLFSLQSPLSAGDKIKTAGDLLTAGKSG